MRHETRSSHITPVGGNVFIDLGFEPKEAAMLKAQSDRAIAEKLAMKETLMDAISQWIERNELKQTEAAQILGVTRPRVSDVVNKKTVKFTIDALIEMLARTGKRVSVKVC
jgi:predicted XRE-type DNA-binding protein